MIFGNKLKMHQNKHKWKIESWFELTKRGGEEKEAPVCWWYASFGDQLFLSVT